MISGTTSRSLPSHPFRALDKSSYGKDGSGHAVVIVGYDETDADNPYWIVLNSWGTAEGKRPNGLMTG